MQESVQRAPSSKLQGGNFNTSRSDLKTTLLPPSQVALVKVLCPMTTAIQQILT